MADPQDNTIPPPPAGFTPVQSAGSVPPPPPGFTPVSTENVPGRNLARVQDDSLKPQPSDPDYYNGEPAYAKVATKAYRAMGGGALGDTNAEVKQRLKEIALHPIDESLSFGKGIMDAQGELAHKAKEAWKNGDHVGAAAYALYYLMPGIGPSLAKAGEQMASGDVPGGIGTTLGTAAPLVMADAVQPEPVVPKTGFKAASEASARASAVKPKVSAQDLSPNAVPLKEAGDRAIAATDESGPQHTTYPRTPEETQQAIKESQGPDAKPLREAGENVQAEAKANREAVGKKVGEAKEEAQASLPKKSTLPIVTIGSRSLGAAAKKVLADTADTEQLAGAKDPDMAEVRDMADHLSKGTNAKGEILTLDPEQIDSVKRAFNNKIDALQAKVDAGGNGTALKNVKALKQAWQEDIYDAFEKHGDPVAARNLRNLSKQYATITDDQFHGPAKSLFRTQKPEQIVSSIVSGGAKSESALDSLMNNSTPKGAATLRDSVQQEIYRQATGSDGNVDASKALSKLQRMGNTGQKLFGSKYQELQTMLADAAKKQAAGEETPSIFSKAQLENPEKIVHDIVSQGATQQSFAENIMKRLPEAEKKTFADSVDAEIRRQTMADDGNIDGIKARKKFYSMSDTAKAVFGDSYQERKQYYDALSKATEAKNKAPLAARIGQKISTGTGALLGSKAGPLGAAAGAEVGSEVGDFLVGKSGAVKIGISPTERIVLSPAEAAAKRPMITKFLKAKAAGNLAGVTAAYNALANPVRKTDNQK